MMNARDFVEYATDGPKVLSFKIGWVPAKPLAGPFLSRLKDAWEVLWGRAEAVCFPGNDDICEDDGNGGPESCGE